jgi:hypothetical protein
VNGIERVRIPLEVRKAPPSAGVSNAKPIEPGSGIANGETDRGAALVAASRLDEILKDLLASFLRSTK